MKFFLILNVLFVLGACAHQHKGHHHGQHHDPNAHMHQRSHEQLIRAFDDPARDQWQRPARVIELMGSLKGKRLIDIGAGSGYFTHKFLKAQAQVVAADVDEKFLTHLRERFTPKQYPGLAIEKVEYGDPLMKKDSFDYAFTSNTYHHINDRVSYFRKVHEGLKPDGKVVILDFRPNPAGKPFGPPLSMRVPVSVVVDELLQSGFDELKIYEKEFGHQYLIIGTKKIR